jgi:hypothetical protein
MLGVQEIYVSKKGGHGVHSATYGLHKFWGILASHDSELSMVSPDAPQSV